MHSILLLMSRMLFEDLVRNPTKLVSSLVIALFEIIKSDNLRDDMKNNRKFSLVFLGTVAAGTLFLSSQSSEAIAQTKAAEPNKKDGYEMKVSEPKTVKVGKEASYTVNLKSKGDWHINQKFPTKLVLKDGNGVTHSKTKMTKADAAKFSESEAEFNVPFKVAGKGSKKLQAELVFSICIESQCSRVTENIEVAVNAK